MVVVSLCMVVVSMSLVVNDGGGCDMPVPFYLLKQGFP